MFINASPIIPMKEIAAYESLWEQKNASFKHLSELFTANPGSRPSDFVEDSVIREKMESVKNTVLNKSLKYRVNVLIKGTFDYPEKLKDAKEPVEVLYYSGNIDLISTKMLAVVGTRNPTSEGLFRTKKLVKQLIEHDFTIVSGLAMGVDTMAHTTAIEEGGRTIAVIGTPLDQVYPKENSELQYTIAAKHLLISQVPFLRYKQQSYMGNRLFFPERNKTMSALSGGTVIVEASETSGTLIQARAALYQKRQLFILDSCFNNKAITWPEKFLKLGAIRVKTIDDILTQFTQSTSNEQAD